MHYVLKNKNCLSCSLWTSVPNNVLVLDSSFFWIKTFKCSLLSQIHYFRDKLITIQISTNVLFKIESTFIGVVGAHTLFQEWRDYYPKCWKSVCIWRQMKPHEDYLSLREPPVQKLCVLPRMLSIQWLITTGLCILIQDNHEGHFSFLFPRCCLHGDWVSANLSLFSILLLSLSQVLIPKYSPINLYANLYHRICFLVNTT